MRIPLALLLALAWLTGCGFKGPLYLPVRNVEAAKPAAPPPQNITTPDEQRPVPAEAAPAPK
jgi:predicted small lipoprotein YifL